ncbi:unnamed protein product [Caenorhabditis sp. 36 PRJEB53466]|nr:unnamed protein product [Caenorhabditis sp. 36 PRJEB53466]
MPRRYTRSSVETGEYAPESPESPEEHSRRVSRFKVEDFPDELLEMDDGQPALPHQPSSGPLEYIPTPKVKKEKVKHEEDEDEEEEEDEEYDEEEYVPTAPLTRRSSTRRSSNNVKQEEPEEETPKQESSSKKKKDAPKEEKKKEKKEKKLSKEQKKKEQERRKLDSELDAELRAAHGGGPTKSKKKKPEKPAYVGGLPTSSIQTAPVVSNPYNYDPKMEMVKLGTGQLKSAYRKSKTNVELHIQKNLYKLEPKRGSQDGDSREVSEEPDAYTPSNIPTGTEGAASSKPILFDYSGMDDYDDLKPPAKRSKIEPISVDIVETPSSSKRRDSRESARPSPYTPTPIVATPSPSNNKPKHSSPAIFSPSIYSPSAETPKAHSSTERRGSDSMRKGVYMPPQSRQDKLIAEASSRHSSISTERRPSFIPQLTSSRTPSTETNALYTPSAPAPIRSSWLPNTSALNRRTVEENAPIDVVNDVQSPLDVLNSPVPAAITPPPVSLAEFTNGRKNNHEEGKKHRMPAKEAMAELKTLVGKLNSLNDS